MSQVNEWDRCSDLVEEINQAHITYRQLLDRNIGILLNNTVSIDAKNILAYLFQIEEISKELVNEITGALGTREDYIASERYAHQERSRED